MSSDSNSVFEAPWSDMGLGPHAKTHTDPTTADDGTDSSILEEAHQRYVAPHRRRPNIEMGEYVAVPLAEKKGDEMGVDNRHFEKVIVRVPYALTKEHIGKASRDWPGYYFQSSGHGNHDHPLAHLNTLVVSRQMQRMMKAGDRALDIYGSPNAAEAYNKSQERARNPKHMTVLVNHFSPNDFIREVNKWGPQDSAQIPDDTSTVIWRGERPESRYLVGDIKDMTSEQLQEYNVFLLHHVLYYFEREWLLSAMVKGNVRRTLASVLRHDKKDGTLNHGEQTYQVRGGFVKQKNVKTNTTYYHPDISPWVFGEKKIWWSEKTPGYGLTWEVHYQCEDNWIVEIVLAEKAKLVDYAERDDWEAQFRAAEMLEAQMEMRLPDGAVTMLPTGEGVVELRVTNAELYGHLRRRAMGKKRVGAEGAKLYQDLCTTAVHLVRPGGLFPDQPKLDVPEGEIIDHVVSAFVSDVVNENTLHAGIAQIAPLLHEHAASMGGSTTDPLGNTLSYIRAALPVASRVANSTGIPVAGQILGALDKAANRILG